METGNNHIAIAIINSLINLKAQNGINGFNLYQWLKRYHSYRMDLSFREFAVKIAASAMTETSCKSYFNTSYLPSIDLR